MSAPLPSLRRQLVWAALAVVLATVLAFAAAAWLLVVRPAEAGMMRRL